VTDKDPISVSCSGYPVFLAPFVEKAVFSPTYIFGTFVKNQMAIAVWVYFWNFYSVPLGCKSVFVSVPC
jgi:hypothetical protein